MKTDSRDTLPKEVHFIKERYLNGKRYLNNKGFSLVELLVSMAILAIVVVPLLNNFVVAAKVSAKAKRIQNETILTQSILEDIKEKSITDIASEYADTTGITASGSEVYYAKKNIEYNGNKYDALITMDGGNYIKDDPMNPSGNKIGHNTIKLPIISELSSSKNIIATESYETDMAVATLYSKHLTYCQEQREAHRAVPGYSITESSEADVRDRLKRIMNIVITQNINISVKIEFVYTCYLPDNITPIPGSGSESYTVEDELFPDTMESIYLFYNPIYSDSILIRKDSTVVRNIDVFVVRQTPENSLITIPEVIETIPDGIHLYSNLINASSAMLVKEETAKTRIYDVNVQLYKAGMNFAQEALCVEFKTTKED